MTDQNEDRKAYARGLHQFATWLAENPAAPFPRAGQDRPIYLYAFDKNTAEGLLRRFAHAATDLTHEVKSDGCVYVAGRMAGLLVGIVVKAADVGVVKGTAQRTITESVWTFPDYLNSVSA